MNVHDPKASWSYFFMRTPGTPLTTLRRPAWTVPQPDVERNCLRGPGISGYRYAGCLARGGMLARAGGPRAAEGALRLHGEGISRKYCEGKAIRQISATRVHLQSIIFLHQG